MNPTFIEHLVIFKTFFGITAHTGDAIKNDGVSCFYLRYKFVPIGSVLLGSGVEFFNDSSGGGDSGDVGNLSGNLLVLGTDAAISVDHNNVPFSIKTN